MFRGRGLSTGFSNNDTTRRGNLENDSFQGHYHTADQLIAGRGAGGSGIDGSGTYQVYVINNYVNAPRDGVNGVVRTGNETRMKNQGVNFFIKF